MKSSKLLFSFLWLLFLFLPSSMSYAQSEDQPATYLIQPGDTLGSIASIFNTSVEELMIANDIPDPNFISPGELLIIPSLFGISGVITPVVLNLGETLGSISRFYGVDTQSLILLNQITTLTDIVAGSTILVPIKENTLFNSHTTNNFTTRFTLFESAIKLDTNIEKIESNNHITTYLPIIGFQRISIDNSHNESTVEKQLTENVLVSIYPLPLKQGTTVTIQIDSPMFLNISGSINGSILHFYSENNKNFFTLQGIHALTEPGITVLKLIMETQEGSVISLEESILIQSENFSTDPPLSVDPETINPKNTTSEENFVKGLTAIYTEDKYWSGIFQSPAYYQDYTSYFGNRRTYNDDPKISFHSGLDFGGGVTLPIVAPADGKVVFSGFLPIRGNTIFIDHGLGVYTGYFHQSVLLADEGQYVTTGQKIGEVGNTGRVSNGTDYPGAGAHLHWEVWVNGVQVNPLDWLKKEYP